MLHILILQQTQNAHANPHTINQAKKWNTANLVLEASKKEGVTFREHHERKLPTCHISTVRMQWVMPD